MNDINIRKADTILQNIEQELQKASELHPKNGNCDCRSEGEARPIDLIQTGQK